MRCVSPNMPSTFESVTVELGKQESLLGQIHFEMNAGYISKEKEDELWGVQRNITQLKVSINYVFCYSNSRLLSVVDCKIKNLLLLLKHTSKIR